MKNFVSRAGEKLCSALDHFKINVENKVCADLGCSTGGFTDCLLSRGARKVYAVDTGYGVLEWKLRQDPRVQVMERVNALHAEFPEQMDFIAIDTGWTKQKLIIPAALKYLKPGGDIMTLVKPHYEAGRQALKDGKIPEALLPKILEQVFTDLAPLPLTIIDTILSPITGEKGGNREYLTWIKKAS